MNPNEKINIFLVVAALVLFDLCLLAFGKEPVKIRVAVLKDAKEVTLAIKGSFDIVDGRTKQLFYKGRDLSSSKVVAADNGIKFRNMTFNTDCIGITAKKTAAITINNRPYRGDVIVFRHPVKKNNIRPGPAPNFFGCGPSRRGAGSAKPTHPLSPTPPPLPRPEN